MDGGSNFKSCSLYNLNKIVLRSLIWAKLGVRVYITAIATSLVKVVGAHFIFNQVEVLHCLIEMRNCQQDKTWHDSHAQT